MKLQFKYFTLLLLVCLLGSDLVHAQQKNAEQGEIVMTQSELDSLLLKIVRHKKEQMAKQRKYRNTAISRRYGDVLQPEEKMMKQEPKDYNIQNEERIYNEFARLNNRLDGLILNMNSGRSTFVPSQGYSAPSGGDPNVFYMQPGSQNQQHPFSPGLMMNAAEQGTNTASGKSGETVVIETSTGRDSDEDTAGKSEESVHLQNQISELTEKVKVLDKLGEATESSEYDQEIYGLNAKIENLKSNLAESSRIAAEERDKREKSQLDSATLNQLREYSLSVYFANNSTSLGNTDKIALEELAKTVKKNEQHLTVMLHGFASKSGTAAYNNKISFERAETVKNVLRTNGVRARNIVVLPHGVDDTGQADQARRVEISLAIEPN